MSEEQTNPLSPGEEHDDNVEAHHWKAGPAEGLRTDAESVKARNDDDVEAHHWKTGPEKFAGPEKFSGPEKFA